MTKLHIGCGLDYKEDYINLDKSPDVKPDVIFDLEKISSTNPLPFEDDTFDEILAAHTLEHIHNILPLMAELHRVTKAEGVLLLRVPYGASASAYDDPTHCRQFYPPSLLYFGQPTYWRADYGYRGDWRVEECGLLIPKYIQERLDSLGIDIRFAVQHMFNIVDEMVAALICVKPVRARDVKLIDTIKPVIEITGGK